MCTFSPVHSAQIENHVLNPLVMRRTVRINPLVVLLSVLIGGSIGDWLGGAFGALVGALLTIPTAASLQIAVREIWQAMRPSRPTRSMKPRLAPDQA